MTVPGLGYCPNPERNDKCGCRERCAICGNPKHSAVHMHLHGQPNSPPYDHAFSPLTKGATIAWAKR